MTDRAPSCPGETGGLAGPGAERTVSLALQGGGAHGAFTWGVLDGARSALETFWRRASVDGSLPPAQRRLLSRTRGLWSDRAWTDLIAQRFSPYELNPLNINPLRDAIDALVDFDRVRACTDVEIFISATNFLDRQG